MSSKRPTKGKGSSSKLSVELGYLVLALQNRLKQVIGKITKFVSPCTLQSSALTMYVYLVSPGILNILLAQQVGRCRQHSDYLSSHATPVLTSLYKIRQDVYLLCVLIHLSAKCG